jgi:hypothetical protein
MQKRENQRSLFIANKSDARGPMNFKLLNLSTVTGLFNMLKLDVQI